MKKTQRTCGMGDALLASIIEQGYKTNTLPRCTNIRPGSIFVH